MAINAVSAPTVTMAGHYTTDTVTSKDGTIIHYRQLGQGPALVILHGAMESAQSHMQLAEALADAFTVYLPERRGHWITGPVRKDYTMQQEVDDLDALMTKTGAENIFGVSAGGLICLQATLTLPAIHKVAVYEPALIVNNSASTALWPRYDKEIAEGKTAAALVTGMLAAQLGPAIFNIMPRWLLEAFTTMGMKGEEKTAKAGDVTMRMLAPTLHYDFILISEMRETLERFKGIGAEMLLLGGTESPAWLKTALDALEKTLPHVKRVEFPGLNHGGSSDPSATNRSSDPAKVAQAMREFFC